MFTKNNIKVFLHKKSFNESIREFPPQKIMWLKREDWVSIYTTICLARKFPSALAVVVFLININKKQYDKETVVTKVKTSLIFKVLMN